MLCVVLLSSSFFWSVENGSTVKLWMYPVYRWVGPDHVLFACAAFGTLVQQVCVFLWTP